MKLLGYLHILFCKTPWIGVPIARSISWVFSLFPWMFGFRGKKSLEEIRQQMAESGEMMDFPFEFSPVEDDSFVLELPYCPYGFTTTDHKRPCETAMDMDRMMLKRCGAQLIITDAISRGDDRCRMIISHTPD